MGALTEDMPEATYRALPGLSGTGVVKLLKSPALYRESVDNPTPQTPAMALGSAFHALVLEGIDPTVSPFDSFRTKEAREWRDANPQALTAEDAERVSAMRDAALSHPDAAHILTGDGPTEVTVTWDHEGFPMKGRIDKVWSARVVDLKSISVRGDDFEDACHKAIGTYGMHIQLPHYRNGLADALGIGHGNLPPVLVFVESDFPHRVAVIELSETDAMQGLELCLEAYRRYADCTEAGVWPDGSPEGIRTSRIPAWAARNWNRTLTGAELEDS